MPSSGVLVLVGTPLGNRQDLSPRAKAAILSADQLWCEDTRSPLRLLGEGHSLPARHSCFAGNEARRCAELSDRLAQGERVVFVSEAGMPAISDPGQMLAEVAWSCGAKVEVIPGPTAAMMALVASGFRAQGAVFWGFLPRKGPRREELMARIVASSGAFVIYEAGNRIKSTIQELAFAMPVQMQRTRRLLVARELTKRHETLYRASLATQLESLAALDERGEFTLVLEGVAHEDAELATPNPARELWDLMQDTKLRPKEKARKIASLVDLDSRAVYAALNQDS